MTSPSIETIIARAASAHGMSPRELTQQSRFPHIVRARHAAYLAGRMAGYSSRVFADAIGRDGGTVRFGIRRAKALAEHDPLFARLCERIASA